MVCLAEQAAEAKAAFHAARRTLESAQEQLAFEVQQTHDRLADLVSQAQMAWDQADNLLAEMEIPAEARTRRLGAPRPTAQDTWLGPAGDSDREFSAATRFVDNWTDHALDPDCSPSARRDHIQRLIGLREAAESAQMQILMAALATAERDDLSGTEFLTALMRQARDLADAGTQLSADAEQVRAALASQLEVGEGLNEQELSQELHTSQQQVNRMIEGVSIGSNGTDQDEDLLGERLSSDNQALLSGLLLRLMNRDPRSETERAFQRHVRSFRKQANSFIEAGDPEFTGAAGAPEEWFTDEWLEERLHRIADPELALRLLVEMAAYQPWLAMHKVLAEDLRHATLEWVRSRLGLAEPLTAGIVDSLVRAFPWQEGEDSKRQRKERVLRLSAVTGAAALGLATGGLAAPIAGAAIGAGMWGGLSGAAATSAGLAALGGGSLAIGGLGMAGGTALIASLGATTGVAAAKPLAGKLNLHPDLAQAEARKLAALILTFEDHPPTAEVAAKYRQELQARLIRLAVEYSEAVRGKKKKNAERGWRVIKWILEVVDGDRNIDSDPVKEGPDTDQGTTNAPDA